MSRQIILISSLGESPAVVTEAIDKIQQEENVQFTMVVTLATSQDVVRQGVEILTEHIRAYYGGSTGYVPDFIEATDVLTEKDNLDYFTLVAKWLRAYPPSQNDVYVSLAGGRKTMSALVALAVQIYGAKLLCHVVHLLMDERLQRKMEASHLRRFPEEQMALLHPDAGELELVRLPVVSLFPLLNDLLSALAGPRIGRIEKSVQRLLEGNHLIEKDADGWRVTPTGMQLHEIISDIELLPEPSANAPADKKVDLKAHHGKAELSPHADRLRLFPYAERVVSSDYNSQFDRSRAVRTPHGRILVQTSNQQDVLRVTLADSHKGYALEVYTRAQSKSQAERVGRELERFLTGQ